MNSNNKKRKIFDGKYEIFSIVGRGQSSVVYHAKTVDRGLDVAIKVLVEKPNTSNNSRDNRELLRKESLSLVSCRHSNVVKLEDFQVLDKLCYLVMEYAPYNDMLKFLNNEVLDYERGEKYLIELLESLDFIHKVGFIHRDICPENILVFNNDVVKLGDFGQGEVVHELNNLQQLKIGMENKDFVAPEYFTNDSVNFNADIYSLGATFYYLFTHSKSFNTDLIKNKKISYCLKKMLQVNPSERFESASKVLDFLNARNPINVEAARRLTRERLDDIDSIEKEFEGFDNIISKKDKDFSRKDTLKGNDSKNSKIDTIKEQKEKFNLVNGNNVSQEKQSDIEENNQAKKQNALRHQIKVKNDFDEPKRDITKMSLKEINSKKLQELEKDKLTKKTINKEINVKDIINSETDSQVLTEDNDFTAVYTLKNKNIGIKRRLFLLVLFIFSILLLLFSLGKFDSLLTTQNKVEVNQIEDINVNLSFPNLQDGIYLGTLEGILFDKVNFNMSVKNNLVVFKMDNDGFEPVIFNNSKNTQSMEIRFNGVILLLKPTTFIKNVVKGKVVNKVTGEKGTWSLKLIKELKE